MRQLALLTLASQIGLVAAGAPATAATQTAPAGGPDFAARVDSISERALRATGVPSASVAVVTHGRLAYAKAYGVANVDSRTPATSAMRYAIGSISKQFTAAAVLLLQQEGKLSLNDPVSRFIPGLTRGNDVTIRQLLSHTSGYQDFWPQDYVMPMMLKSVTPQRIADEWAKKPLDFEPGSRWQYSNTNYTLAGMVVERASGEPYYKFIQDRILTPLGISAANFDENPAVVGVTGYLRYALGPLRPAPDAGAGWMWAAGELAMTPADLARWDISLMDRSLLRPESYRALETETLLNNGSGTQYGLGVDVFMQGGHFTIEHSGEVSGFTSENMVFPDDSAAIVVLTNQDAAPASGAIAQQIAQILFANTDTLTPARTAEVRRIFEGLQRGQIDRSLFTANANAYFTDQALKDFASSLGPLGAPTSFVQTRQSSRGGMIARSYAASFPGKTLRVWIFETPDGKLEQLQVAPQG